MYKWYFESSVLRFINRQQEILVQTKKSGMQLYFVYCKSRIPHGWTKRSAAGK
ncbi:MAG: hypothetical protein J6Q30_06245 [Oscillospiraceae bacterium]|nr:hypothetical protein [Oscillospiraceae bacterium]